jgi:hypothetical protein
MAIDWLCVTFPLTMTLLNVVAFVPPIAPVPLKVTVPVPEVNVPEFVQFPATFMLLEPVESVLPLFMVTFVAVRLPKRVAFTVVKYFTIKIPEPPFPP